MGREVRMVPANLEHPKEFNEWRHEMVFRPLLGGSYAKDAAQWDEENYMWSRGFKRDWTDDGFVEYDGEPMSFEEWSGYRPIESDYMPDWPVNERTHFMMYENTSEGTPISPSFATAEELAHWLADAGASAFAGDTASYGEWLAMIRRGWAISAVYVGGQIVNGVSYG